MESDNTPYRDTPEGIARTKLEETHKREYPLSFLDIYGYDARREAKQRLAFGINSKVLFENSCNDILYVDDKDIVISRHDGSVERISSLEDLFRHKYDVTIGYGWRMKTDDPNHIKLIDEIILFERELFSLSEEDLDYYITFIRNNKDKYSTVYGDYVKHIDDVTRYHSGDMSDIEKFKHILSKHFKYTYWKSRIEYF